MPSRRIGSRRRNDTLPEQGAHDDVVGALSRAALLVNTEPGTALLLATECCSVAARRHDDEAEARAAYLMAQAYSHLGKHGEAQEQYERARSLYESTGNALGAATAIVGIGIVHRNLGKYDAALVHFRAALTVYERLDDLRGMAEVTARIGNTHRRLDDHAKAIEYLDRALALLSGLDEKAESARVTGSLGSAYFGLGEYTEALARFRSAQTLAIELEDRRGIAAWTARIGLAQLRLGDHQAALTSLRAGLRLFEQIDDRDGIAGVTGDLGRLHGMPSSPYYDPRRAEELLLRAVDMVSASGLRPLISELHHELAELYRQQSDWDRSLRHLKAHHALREEIQSHAAHNLEQYLEHRERVEEVERRRSVEQAETHAATLNAQLLELRLERQHQELVATAVSLARQADLLDRLRSDVRAIVSESDDCIDSARRLQEKLRAVSPGAIDWATFDANFRTSYPDFGEKLFARYPDLSPLQVRICALLKLRMTTAHIAELFGLSPRSIEWHRSNLRKKLGLERGDDIHQLLDVL